MEFLNQELLSKPYLGVDTEFRRTTKHNMKLALLQINDAEEIYLIDTILISDPKEHASFLFSSSVKKIFHSCKEDIEAIYSWTNKKVTNIFDTQLANSFLGGEYSIGYQNLVEIKLGITLEKKETRSNWLRRPLTDAQLKYAALDVEYLIYLYIDQQKELSESVKAKWQEEDLLKMISTSLSQEDISKEKIRIISKNEESHILKKFNSVVEKISSDLRLNPTLFFSKKTQKDFLRAVIADGFDEAAKDITTWRRDLVREEIFGLLK